MNTDELKEWMNGRFDTLDKALDASNDRLEKLSEKVTCHDRWLWLIKGIGLTAVTALGCVGIKIKYF